MRSRSELAELKRAHPLPAVVAGYGVALRPGGWVLLGCCPFHDDNEPSLLVDPRDDHFHCFGCRAHGDVLDFVQRMEGIDFRRAVELLAGAPPRPATTTCGATGRNSVSPGARRRSLPWETAERAAVAAAVALYHHQLLTAPCARAYVAQRGLTRDTIVRYRLGYAVGDTLQPELRRQGLSVAAARRVGLLDRDGHERLAGRLVVPELRNRQPIWLIGRTIAPDAAGRRYLGLSGPKPLLGWEDTAGATVVFLTEGPFDWLLLRQWDYPALALVGTHVRPEVLRSLDRFQTVTLVLDNDEAGQAAAGDLAKALGPSTQQVSLPIGVKDVAELARCPNGQAIFAGIVSRLPAAPAAGARAA